MKRIIDLFAHLARPPILPWKRHSLKDWWNLFKDIHGTHCGYPRGLWRGVLSFIIVALIVAGIAVGCEYTLFDVLVY